MLDFKDERNFKETYTDHISNFYASHIESSMDFHLIQLILLLQQSNLSLNIDICRLIMTLLDTRKTVHISRQGYNKRRTSGILKTAESKRESIFLHDGTKWIET